MITHNPEADRWDDQLFLEFYTDIDDSPVAEFSPESGFPVPDVGELVHLEEFVDQEKGLTIELEQTQSGLFRVTDRMLEYTRNEASMPAEDLDTEEAKARASEMDHEPAEFFFVTVRLVGEILESPDSMPEAFQSSEESS